jgi:LysM repeat protein
MFTRFGIRTFFSLAAVAALLFTTASAAPVTAFAQAQSNGQYVVQAGDTLSQIAAEFNTSVAALLRANPQVSASGTIYTGEVLELPGALLVNPTTGIQQYFVQSGDTLGSIAARFGVSISDLLAWNSQISDASLIYPGELINLSGSAVVIPNTGSATYTVQAGDSMVGIAAQYGTTLAALEQANPQVTDPSLIYPGEVINLPSAVIPNTGSSTYTVQAGNTLSTIAAEFGTTVTALEQANPQITDPNLIYTGEVINLPVPVVIPNTGGQTYTVQPGDTLLSIANQYGTTVGALLTANPSIVDQNLIYPGEVIAIP